MRTLRGCAAAGLLALAGCATPIGVSRLGPQQAYIELHENALNSDRYSADALYVLQRYDLIRPFEKDPDKTLKRLHEKALGDDRPDILYALSELSYRNAERLSRRIWPSSRRRARDYYLASAIYAYLYLFGGHGEGLPGRFDQRPRLAADLYNRGLALGLMKYGSRDAELDIGGGRRETPFGPVQIRFVAPGFEGKLGDIDGVYSADEFHVRGLTPRNREPGLGVPLTVITRKMGVLQERRRAPATVFLRLSGDLSDWNAGELKGALEGYATFEAREIQVEGKPVPLQIDSTVPLASALGRGELWKAGQHQFFSAVKKKTYGVRMIQPYAPGRIPVVFVHGTASSPIYWAQMWNMLRADETLRKRYQFWSFSYATANPITVSALLLRDGLSDAVKEVDPKGTDPALRRMVIIGHSQGGLLAKLTATDTGDKLWRIVSDKKLAELDVDPESREQLRRNLFFKPLPLVKRVVFIATPHRGSYRNTRTIRSLLNRLVSLPGDVVQSYQRMKKHLPETLRHDVPSSLRGMSPDNPFMLALADIPVAPGIKANSIIAVKDGRKRPEGNDGVVEYKSAHVDYAESELVVRSPHSCQSNPFTIEEVRRILLEHLKDFPKIDAS